MQYSQIQTNFSSILNRRDLTPTQLSTFMGMAIQRIQRKLRCPAMEKIVEYTMDSTGTIPVPGDLLELIDITFNSADMAPRKLTRVDHQTAMRLNQCQSQATSFYRQGGQYLIGPSPTSGSIAYITYYADAGGLAADTDHNWLTDACPDLLIYGALSYAADTFIDERGDKWEARFQGIYSELDAMAKNEELIGASISPAYSANSAPYFPYDGEV